jgi:hypothetical protein
VPAVRKRLTGSILILCVAALWESASAEGWVDTVEIDPKAWQAVAETMHAQGELAKEHDVSEYLLR